MSELTKYAAELLFEFDKVKENASLIKKRICERKIVVIYSNSDQSAYESALKRGKADEFTSELSDLTICYNFLGVLELISLENEDDDIVWSNFEERLLPKERIDKLIPKKEHLKVFNEISGKGKIKLLG